MTHHITRWLGVTHHLLAWCLTTCHRYRAFPWALPIIVVCGLLLLLVVAVPLAPYLCCAPSRGGRPIAIQAVINMRKRLKGPPQGCPVAEVVTDIEGYSGGGGDWGCGADGRACWGWRLGVRD